MAEEQEDRALRFAQLTARSVRVWLSELSANRPHGSSMDGASLITGLQINSHCKGHLLFICLSAHVLGDLLLPHVNRVTFKRAAKGGSQLPGFGHHNWPRGESTGILPRDFFFSISNRKKKVLAFCVTAL